MKVSIHQPQYIPWLPYFLKIAASDLFIILDTVDFQKNGLQNRNQIKTAQGAHWLTVPVKHKFGQKISEVLINNDVDWRRKHFQTIRQCYTKAAVFKDYEEELISFYNQDWKKLSELNTEFIFLLLKWLEIETPVIKSSQMNASGNSSELILNLCLESRAQTYLSGMGGKNYLDYHMFKEAGIAIEFQAATLPKEYPQLFPNLGSMTDLSTLDILLNCGVAWRNYLNCGVS